MSPLVYLFVSENGIRVFIGFTSLSRDENEVVWDRIGVHVITYWSSGRSPCCKTTPTYAFFIVSTVCHLPTKWESWCYIWNDNENSTENLLVGIIGRCTYIEGCVCQRCIHGFVSVC